MSVPSGIHVFYVAHRYEPKYKTNGVCSYLYRLQFNGAAVVLADDLISMDYRNWVGGGASAIPVPMAAGVQINIQCTMSGSNNVHYVTYNDASKYVDGGPIATLKSSDRTSAILEPGKGEQIWYTDAGSTALYYQNSGEAGVQYSPNAVPVSAGSGPGAIFFAGASYVAIHQGSDKTRVWRLDLNGTTTDISPPAGSATIAYSPTLIGLDDDRTIMLLYSSSDDDVWSSGQRGLYYNLYDVATGQWSLGRFVSAFPDRPQVDKPTLMTDSPGACVFGDRVYCFYQNPANELWMQVYMGDRWMIDAVQVTDPSGAAIQQVWYGPCAVAI